MSSLAKQNALVDFSIKVKSKEIDKKYPVFSIVVNKTINKIPYAWGTF